MTGTHYRGGETPGESSPATVLRRQRRQYRARRVEFARIGADTTAGELLAAHPDADVIELCGVRLRTLAELVPFVADVPAGWRAAGHYLRTPTPVLRYEHERSGSVVELVRAAAYFGDGAYDAPEAADAYHRLERLVSVAFDEGRVLLTPASTGRYLLLRSIPFGREWAVLDGAQQERIRGFSGGGRIQHWDRGERRGSIVEYDARLAYAACARELGAGELVVDHVDEYAGQQRGWYAVRATVPGDWNSSCRCGAPGHPSIGILGRYDAGELEYPAEPGRTFAAFAEGSELHVALRHGWRVEIVERYLHPHPPYPAVERRNGQTNKRGPLDEWAGRIGRMREAARGDRLVSNALRMIVLAGIGALQGRGKRNTYAAHIDQAAELVAGVPVVGVERAGDTMLWHTENDAAAWPELSHPEWCGAIWARARARLLDGPGGTGALNVPASTVLAMRTDALYLTTDPRWPDAGRLGQYRRVRAWHDVPIPRTARELDDLKRARP